VLAADKVNVPAPALVTAKAETPSLIIPVIELVSLFVTLNVPVDLIAAAVNTSVVIVSPVRAVVPTAPVNVTSPVDPLLVIVKAKPPSTVELNKIVPLGEVNVGLAVKVMKCAMHLGWDGFRTWPHLTLGLFCLY